MIHSRPFSIPFNVQVQSSIVLSRFQDNVAIEKAKDVLDGKSTKVEMSLHARNIDRTFGATLSHMISMYDPFSYV